MMGVQPRAAEQPTVIGTRSTVARRNKYNPTVVPPVKHYLSSTISQLQPKGPSKRDLHRMGVAARRPTPHP